jgi:uncharacterized protein
VAAQIAHLLLFFSDCGRLIFEKSIGQSLRCEVFNRTIEPVLKRFAKVYPVIGITGPRQSGKTTTAKRLFPHLPHVSLEDLDVRASAKNDPRAFLSEYKNGAIFDEVQNVPELLSYLQGIVDSSEDTGKYVITGSQNFALSNTVSQSLAGRIGMVTLLPLSICELGMNDDVELNIFNGGYPRLHKLKMSTLDFYPSYIQTYIERDVRTLKNVENLRLFKKFLGLCAGRVGQVINFSSLASDCEISTATARQWLAILEASYLVFFLQPFYKNFSKRLIKMPKLYFYDTGLVCNLLGLREASQLKTHYLTGSLYENLVILEILKGQVNRGFAPNLYFWRDRTGNEIDLVGEWGGVIKAIEIKSGATFKPEMLKNLQYFKALSDQAKTKEAGPEVEQTLIYSGDLDGEYKDVSLLPFKKIEEIF